MTWTPAGVTRDTWLLFAARALRLFAYGALSIVLVFYLIAVGLTEAETGLLLTLTLLGDTVVSAVIGTRADRVGRRKMLVVGALLMTFAALVFISTRQFAILLVAATIGVISPSGQEVGPFLPIEQAALSAAAGQRRTEFFAWYTLIGSVATALGALAAGVVSRATSFAATPADRYRPVVVMYAAAGLLLALLFARLSAATESRETDLQPTDATPLRRHVGLDRSGPVVMKLSALFALDAFGGGFVAQGFAAYWFHLRFGADPATLGPIFFGANLLSGVSALVAARLAARFGLLRTMVWTHLPSNVLLILIPLMPTLPVAVALLLVRFSISQMDVPTRQSYVMAVVEPRERSAAGAMTGVARTIGAAVSPVLVGGLFSVPALVNWPYFIAGTVKIAYDLLLYRAFRSVSVDPAEGS